VTEGHRLDETASSGAELCFRQGAEGIQKRGGGVQIYFTEEIHMTKSEHAEL
jgi:hypothetical protein